MTYKTHYILIIILFLNLIFNKACEKESKKQGQNSEIQEKIIPDYPPHPKKGFGTVTKSIGWNTKLEKLNVSWHYSWGHELKNIQTDRMEFVPMIWGAC